MIVDACVHLGACRYGGELTLTAAAGLGADTVIAVAASPPGRDLAAATARLLSSRPPGGVRLAVLARVDPWEPGALAAAQRALDGGAVGLFVHPWEENVRVTDPVLDPFMRLGRPVMVEGGFPWVSEPAQLAELAVRHPDVPVVATRGGHMNMSGLSGQSALHALRRAPNLHVLTSGVYRQDWLDSVVAEFGPSRLLYGSLAPHLDARLELLRARELPEEVLSESATRIFGLRAPGAGA